ncbi:putative serine/arginine repetitive matrix protein 2-like [Penaeus vannamei]|uniref:Putative serine/arginine repetitive matrix protein 2-like n=1 Tax=Penaeus vannamei TaxID=6689 RepID=A0A3R7SPD8_PENVA|nr:putative serine/arginine repetitive matrix protein 2-like [Penaeus vannamei]
MANESEYVEEPELFVMESLQPMLFSIRVCPTKAALQRIIEDHGGELTSKVGGPHTLRLLPIGEKSFSVSSDVFSAQYIYDCVKEKRLLDPSKYRVNKNSCYTDDIKVLDIIRGVRSWADCVRVEIEGPEDVSDFSDDENFNVLMQNRTWKTGRRPYSRNEQKSILEFIIKNKRYGEVKGNVLWKDMEKRKVCPLRSWESMKEHYRKVIITDLAPYQLSKKIEAKLYKGYTDGKYHKESSDDDEELRKDQRGKAVTQKEVSSDPKETQVEDEQSELTWQEEADIEDEEETEDEDQEEADEEGIKKTMNDIMYDEVERQVASFDAGVANCTQSFEVVLADGEFENPPKQTDNYLKELADDWEESRGSFPGQSQNKEENAAACAENKQERGRSESALTGNLQKSTRDEDGTQDREGVFSSSDPDEQSHQVVDAEIPSSESTSKIVKTKKNTDMFTEKEAEEIANYLIEMSNSDPWEEPAVTDLKHNKCGDAGGNSVQQNNCKGTSIVVNNGEQADTSTETIIFQTCPTSTDSHTNQEAGKDRNLVHDPCNSVDGKEITKVLLSPFLAETESSGEESDRSIILFSEGEICRKRSVGEEEADKKNLLNGSKGTRSSSASETKKKSKKGQLQDRQSGNSSVSSTSKDVSQEKTRMRKPQKRKPHLDESTSSDSEVLITRSRKVDMGQILSCPSKGVPQKTRSIHSEEETEEEDVSSHTPDRQRQNGRRSTEENSSPGGTSSGSLQRVKHQLQKERETKLDVSSEVMRKMKGGEKVSLEENSSDSDGNDDDSLITEEENNSYLSTSLMSDPCSSIDSFTGFYDRSFYPSRCHELRLDLTRRVAKISTGNGDKENPIGNLILPELRKDQRGKAVTQKEVSSDPKETQVEDEQSELTWQEEADIEDEEETEDEDQEEADEEGIKKTMNDIMYDEVERQVGGKSLWTLMATCEGGLKGRSWLSLKERFRMSIVKHLHSFNLSDDEILKFEKYGNRSKNQKITHRHQPDASVYKFAKIRLSPRTKKRSATSSVSESEVPREQKEEVSRERKNERRLSPRKRNSMNFTQTPSSTTSQSETKRKKERNSLPATVSSHDKRVTRRFLELEKTLPRQKLRVRPLHKNK